MAGSRFQFSFILAFLGVSVVQSNMVDFRTTSCSSHQVFEKTCELEEAKRRVVQLESIIKERIADINAKNHYISKCETKIVALVAEIDRLNEEISDFGDDYPLASQKLDALEEEVRLLWAASRKNNFDIYSLELMASDAEKRLKELTDKVQEMSEIVSEQWIQIQRLEQAVHLAEVRASKVKQRESVWTRCPFVKSAIILVGDYVEKVSQILCTYFPIVCSELSFFKSQLFHVFSAAKSYHHQLQGSIKLAMKRSVLTAAIAHDEVVFVMASTLIASPIMSTCMLLSLLFS